MHAHDELIKQQRRAGHSSETSLSAATAPSSGGQHFRQKEVEPRQVKGFLDYPVVTPTRRGSGPQQGGPIPAATTLNSLFQLQQEA